ncbi:hypothetical protein CHLRE_12g508850v5 [Chlamydomonas reinhardtii]|uniref:Uncharacterized protein n=1 Tax=Chlamydomonas reinhardtii TaxID=3055 RepID=A8IKD4_CHLRE|nr:uncharacterized protein CHLRE_12g508850v5 [Chlamydomonas reinhardtii]PNW74809.1 hypothetical protein CHLRE_12g508850v5 [Chlamydomonas reinhardtii]|eukprot:XP_001691033.1 glutathione S-transferase [Chlamydomonas reinhardtii]
MMLTARSFASARTSRRTVCHVSASKAKLFDVPVSNNGARNRFIIRKKGLEGQIDIVTPQTIGGLKSPEYLALNPQGKMPLLVTESGWPLPESEVISQYLLDKYASHSPSLVANTPEGRARANLATRIHDVYIVPIQGCMYRTMDSVETRAKQIEQIAFQLNVLEGIVQGPFVAGSEITAADAALFPTFVFFDFILPTYFGWKDVFAGKPKLKSWWENMKKDAEGAKIYEEIRGGLQGWANNNRWRDQGITDHVANSAYKWAY